MTDHAAAVEAVRVRWQERRTRALTVLDMMEAQDDISTLLRAYEAVVEERESAQADARECHAVHFAESAALATLRAQHAALVAVIEKEARVENILHQWICDYCGEVWAHPHRADCHIGKLLATVGGAEGASRDA